jgi:PleD family two-component response regulator
MQAAIRMASFTHAPPVLLVASAPERSLAGVLQGRGYKVLEAPTGASALECARETALATILLDAELPDMSGIVACGKLHGEPHIGHYVPILILGPEKPTPEERVIALRAGAWDFLRYPTDVEEFSLTLETYLQAKRNVNIALAEGTMDPVTRVHSRSALARRARELGALMARKHGALSTVVFALDGVLGDPRVGSLVAHATRQCDVVGVLGPTEVAVLAPATDQEGAVRLARRVADVLRTAPGGHRFTPGLTFWVGYEAVTNLTYSPIDPVELLTRASAAVRHGIPEPDFPWLRRFDSSARPGPVSPPTRSTPTGIVSDKRSSNS